MREDERKSSRAPQLRKLYSPIGEVVERTGIPDHILRYWENEFPQLRPKRGRGGNRLYTERDIELVLRIQDLIQNKKFTIAGARKQLELSFDGAAVEESNGDVLELVKKELREILELMEYSGRGAAR
ncbi:MerR family transcriptional regulator [bacterium]|jgi:DNA-binding transcriptional MerR regulator|nr:MerR family transcriptional regulator [bacterium]